MKTPWRQIGPLMALANNYLGNPDIDLLASSELRHSVPHGIWMLRWGVPSPS